MSKELIRLVDCTMAFDDEVVLDNITLNIHDKEFLTLLGPSGCGKTTTLRIIGGFQTPTAGDVFFDGVRINAVPAHKRAINTVFQRYALFPHLNVFENIAFGLRIPKTKEERDEKGKVIRRQKVKLTEKEIQERVMEMLDVVNLKGFEKRSVSSLSGGQQQRVAIARALVNRPKVLLLDEPLGALDMRLRKDMQNELKRIQQAMGITFIYVTHDQEEALTMSDKIVVMKEGEIQQIGSPTDIYNEPVNEYVANFIGESNIIDGVMLEDYKVMFEDKVFDCVDFGFDKNEAVDVVIRPEDLDIVPRTEGKLRGIVKSVLFKGVHYETVVETKLGTAITVKMVVKDGKPVFNAEANEKMSANDFYLDTADVDELDAATIIARADAQAWNPDTDEFVSIKDVVYQIKKENGTYPVTFSTAAGTSVTVNMIVKDENRVANKEYEEEIFAVNFFKNADEITESIALDTDLKTWANASAWSLEDGKAVEITNVHYDFDPETITPGVYDVTFSTEGYEYKVDTTDKYEVGDIVGLSFQPEDIHIMSKN